MGAVARIAKLFLILPGVALVLAGCGSVHAGAGAPASVTASASASALAARPAGTAVRGPVTWHTFSGGLNTTTIHLDGSGRVLLIPVQAPFGDRACLRDFKARVTAFSSAAAYVMIDYQEVVTSRQQAGDSPTAYDCPVGPVRTVRIKLPGPLGRRQVILDRQVTFWAAGATRLTECGVGAICHKPPPWPPPASCTDASYGQAMVATYPPAHADYNAVGCDGRWLVLNVGWPGGAARCGGPSCAEGSTVTHWFFRASKKGWVEVGVTLTAGCAYIHQAVPQFPTRLCASLPAVGPDAGNQG